MFTIKVNSQNVGIGINNVNPDPSAILDINATNKGLLIPRVSLMSTTDIATVPGPSVSLLVYNLSTISDVSPGFYYFEGNIWKKIGNEDNQNISGSNLTGSLLTIGIENGNSETIDLSSLQGGSNQNLSLTGNVLSISGGNNVILTDNINDADFDVTNELQTISKIGNIITLSNNGGSFTDSDTQLTEAQVDSYVSNNGFLTNFTEVDGSITNELNISMSLNSSTRILDVVDAGGTKSANFNTLLDSYVFYKRIFFPSATTMYLVQTPSVEIRTTGVNPQIEVANISPNQHTLSYSVDNGPTQGNWAFTAGSTQLITIPVGQMVKIHYSQGFNSFLTFEGTNTGSGHLRGILIQHN